MATLVRRSSPLSELFDWLQAESPIALGSPAQYIRVEAFTEDNTYVIRAEMPGVDPEKDIEISIEGDVLSIRGERHEEQKDKQHSEFRYGSFTRTLQLPPGTKSDEVTASYDNGVLEVRVPTGEVKQEATKIPVQRATGSAS